MFYFKLKLRMLEKIAGRIARTCGEKQDKDHVIGVDLRASVANGIAMIWNSGVKTDVMAISVDKQGTNVL